jgi:hypothetical protein
MIGWRIRALACVAVTTAFLAACSVISGLDRDYGLASTEHSDAEGGAADGRTGVDGEVVDGSSESGRADSGGPFDCANPPGTGTVLWCDDFESNKAWTRSDSSGGAPVVEAGAGVDGSRGLRATVKGTGSSVSSVLWQTLANDFPDGKTLTARFSFSVKLASIDYAVIGAVQFNRTEYGLAVFKSTNCPGSASCLDQNEPTSTPHSYTNAITYDPSRWYTAEIKLTREAGSFTGNVTVDGQAVDANRARHA